MRRVVLRVVAHHTPQLLQRLLRRRRCLLRRAVAQVKPTQRHVARRVAEAVAQLVVVA